LPCGLPMPTLNLRRSLCVVLCVRGGLACVVLGFPNGGIGLVGVVLGVPICNELAIVVVRSLNTNVGPAPLRILPKLVLASLRCGRSCIALGDSTSALGSSCRSGNPGSRWAGWCCRCVQRFPTSVSDFSCCVCAVVLVLWGVDRHW
jgi:hypothetical protein